ncbi:MAG: NifU family protein [Coriobacteriales bacterium]|nr:NifU family protein [Coriobacteriales bacterium]
MAVDKALLQEVISVMREALQADGGDLSLIDVAEDGTVTVEMVGSCAECPFSAYELSTGIERIIKERVPGVTKVVALDD